MTERTGAMTIGELYAEVMDTTGDRLVARWLCETAVGLDGEEFLAAADEPVTTTMAAHLDAMLVRWRSGEPLHYVLGRWAFRYLDVSVDRRVLIPRPETEEVAAVAIDLARRRHLEAGAVVVVDLGTGSGVIGLSVARELPHPGTEVWLTDVDADALDVARANLAGLGRNGVGVRVVEGSWFVALPADLAVEWLSRDGRRVLVRPVRPEDAEAHRAFFARLPPEDVRYRFFAPMRELPLELTARLTQIDYDREMAFVAVQDGRTVGVARLVRDPGRDAGEFALVVEPGWKGQGLGRHLMERLFAWGRQAGLREVVGEVLADNVPMLGFVRSLGFSVHRRPDEAEAVEVRRRLDET